MPATTLPGATWTLGDLTVTRFGYGAMQLAGPGVMGPPTDRDGALAVLRKVVDLGITHIDTSNAYGPRVTNQLIREALHPYPDALHLVTKVGATRDAQGGWPPARQPHELRRSVQENLDTLGLEALDLVNLRVGDARGPQPGSLAEALRALVDLQQEGLIRHLGVSNATPEQVAEARAITPIVCVQNLYNLAHRDDDDLIDSLAAAGVAYVPFSLSAGSARCSPRHCRPCRPAGHHPDVGRPRVAAAALAEHPADPRHLFHRAPAGERRRRGARAVRPGHRRSRHDRPLTVHRSGGGRRCDVRHCAA